LFNPTPSINRNVKVANKLVIENEKIKKIIADCEAELSGKGKLIVRPSGTEPLIRITAEGEDTDQINSIVEKISVAIGEA
jgi:phosphoglucosamine mutase